MRYATAFDASGSDFTWRLARDGYELKKADRQYGFADALAAGVPPFIKRTEWAFSSKAPLPEAFKTPKDFEAWQQEHFTTYKPADRADLHRRFAEVDSRPQDALSFVGAHGLITRSIERHEFLEDFYAGQQLIRGILEVAERPRVSGRKVEEVINKNGLHFLLGVTANSNGKLILRVLPDSLLGWMLLKAVEQLTGTTWKYCVICGGAFAVFDERQARQKFCSNRCRQKSHRDRGRH